jgi:hypothetical protein
MLFGLIDKYACDKLFNVGWNYLLRFPHSPLLSYGYDVLAEAWTCLNNSFSCLNSSLNDFSSCLNDLFSCLNDSFGGRLQSSKSVGHESEQRCSISINGTRLTASQYDECIRFHINGYHLRNHVQEKQGWSNSVWDEIDFYTFGKHFRRLKSHQQAIWMKIVHNQLPLGERRYQQSVVKEESLRKCPCCRTANKSLLHFMQCRSNPVFLSSLQTMQDSMSKQDNHPVCHLIYSGLHHSL